MLLAGFAEAQTAAEIDWVPRSQLDEATRADLLWFDEGAYVAPAPRDATADGPVTAFADETEQVVDEYIDLKGNVVIERGTGTVSAPRIRFDEKRQVADVDGPVRIRDAGVLLAGNRARLDLFSESGIIESGSFLLHDLPLRGRSETLERFPDRRLVLNNASLTRCEPGNNSWTLSTPDLTLDPAEGRGTARNVVIRVKDVPVLYTPYVSFSLDQRRKSGLLTPSFGYDSESGTEITVPYYFNIAPSIDATYEAQSVWRRGVLHDGQLRFLAGETRNEINAGILLKDELYDPSGIVDETGNTSFEKRDRWYLNVRHESDDDGPWSTLVDYSAVSDIDYLGDLEGRIGSASDRYAATVGANAGDYRVPVLRRTARAERRGQQLQYYIEAMQFQVLDPAAPPAYRKLPEFGISWQQSLFELDLSLTGRLTRFDKDTDGTAGIREIVGDRAVLDGDISWTARTAWGFIKPGVGAVWRRYRLDDVPQGFDESLSSMIPRFSIDAGLYFDRFFEVGDTAWQQTLEPRLFFLHVKSENQDQFPDFDAREISPRFESIWRWNRYTGYDRIGDANQLSVGLQSRFIRRDTGRQLLSVGIGQIQYFSDRDVNYRLVQPGNDPTRERSPLFVSAQLNPRPGFSLSGTYEFEPEVGRSNRGTLLMSFHSPDYRRLLNLTYVHINPDVQNLSAFANKEESDISFIWPLTRTLSAIGRWNFNWDDDQTLESFAGIEYNNCCLKARVLVRRFLEYSRDVTFIRDTATGPVAEVREITPADTGIFVEFQFKGLATLGRRLDILLERGIPGYRQRETIIGQ